MGLRELYRRIVEAEQGRSVSTAAPSHLREAAPAITTEDWFWGRVGTTGTEEDYFWRRLSDNWTQKDVLPATYLEIHNQVYEAYNANPMANAIVEMGVNFTLGDGLQIDAKHPKVQKLIDAFWNDPDNRMPTRQYDIATELSLSGEIFVRLFVNPYSGHVKIGMIDPSLIDEIECDPSLIDEIECDPHNIEKQLRCHRRPLGQQLSATQALGAGAPADPSARGYPMGVSDNTTEIKWMAGQWYSIPDEVLHFAINKVTNAKRGKSDLATLLPWLRRYRDWLLDRVRINKYKSAFLWDVQLMGADRKTIEAKLMEYSRPPEPGSVLVHNESEQWKAVQPMIDAGNVAADGQAIKMMVAMGAGLPEHYLAEGGDVNRATAAEMSLPTMKKYQRRQDYLGILFRTLLDRVISEAQKAGSLPRTIDTHYEIRFPRLQSEQDKDVGFAAFYMARAIQMAQQQGLISQDTARRLFLDAAREEIDLNEEIERLRQQLHNPAEIAARQASKSEPEGAGQPQSSPTPLKPRSHPTDPLQAERPTHRRPTDERGAS